MVALKKAAEIHRQLPRPCLVQGLPPSPSPSTSTVGTPLYSYTSTSSYDDPATGKNSDTIELNSCISSHSVSPINGTPIDETPKSLPIPDMSRWSLPALPAPAEEVPYDIVKNSIFNGAPVLGLEKSTYDYDISGDDIFTGFGEPTDLADVYADVMDSMGIQGIKERGEDCGDEKGKHGAEVEHVLQGEHVVAAGPTTSGIAPETCVSGTAWLDEADLLADSLALDDVDLSNLDIPGLDDIVIDSDMEQLFESISKSTPPTLSESLPPRP